MTTTATSNNLQTVRQSCLTGDLNCRQYCDLLSTLPNYDSDDFRDPTNGCPTKYVTEMRDLLTRCNLNQDPAACTEFAQKYPSNSKGLFFAPDPINTYVKDCNNGNSLSCNLAIDYLSNTLGTLFPGATELFNRPIINKYVTTNPRLNSSYQTLRQLYNQCNNNSDPTTCATLCQQFPQACKNTLDLCQTPRQSSPFYQQVCNNPAFKQSVCANSSLPNNVTTDFCRDYCTTNNCNRAFEAFCSIPSNFNDPNCGCFLPTSFYDNYYQQLQQRLGVELLSTQKECTYPPCAGSNIKPAGFTTCPPITQCINQVTVDNAGNITGNIDVNTSTQCAQFLPSPSPTSTPLPTSTPSPTATPIPRSRSNIWIIIGAILLFLIIIIPLIVWFATRK